DTSTVTTCNATTGDCRDRQVPKNPPTPPLRSPGILFESSAAATRLVNSPSPAAPRRYRAELNTPKPPPRLTMNTALRTVRETEIDGVLCFFVDMERPLSSAHLLFRTGLADEPLHESGWLHLLEHLAL